MNESKSSLENCIQRIRTSHEMCELILVPDCSNGIEQVSVSVGTYLSTGIDRIEIFIRAYLTPVNENNLENNSNGYVIIDNLHEICDKLGGETEITGQICKSAHNISFTDAADLLSQLASKTNSLQSLETWISRATFP